MTTIPANEIVSITPNVLSAGGDQLDLVGLFLTNSTRVPIGTVKSFATAVDVGTYFGSSSNEKTAADKYFAGFEDSNTKPGSILFAQYPTAAVAGYVRGGALGLTLAQLQALTPATMTVVVDAVSKTSSAIDLSTATSFSNAAALILAAFTSPGFTVTYDSTAGAFVIMSSSTGASSTVAFPTGAFATSLKMTAVLGAVQSAGAIIAVPATFMDAVVAQTQNWAAFTTIFNPDVSGNANKLALAAWNDAQNERFVYVAWDTDLTPATSNPASASLGQLIKSAEYSGTICFGGDGTSTVDYTYAAFILGYIASIDFEELNGRTVLAFRRQDGLLATASGATSARNLIANGYNFLGAYATANDEFVWVYDGQISGDFAWADSFINQIWINNGLQLALMTLLQNAKSIPYNDEGYALIESACQDPIDAAVNFGAIRAGVPLTSQQRASVNSAAGTDIADTLTQQGWYLQVLPADGTTRAERETPPIKLWYMDGQSVQQIDVTSINVQ